MKPSEVNLVPGEGCHFREPGAVRWRLLPALGCGLLDPVEGEDGECLYLAPAESAVDCVTVLAQDAEGVLLGAACIQFVRRPEQRTPEAPDSVAERTPPPRRVPVDDETGGGHEFDAPRFGGRQAGPRGISERARAGALRDCRRRDAFDLTKGTRPGFRPLRVRFTPTGFRAALLTAYLFLV